MNLAITRIKQIIPHFNDQALTEKDFWKICENEEIPLSKCTCSLTDFISATVTGTSFI